MLQNDGIECAYAQLGQYEARSDVGGSGLRALYSWVAQQAVPLECSLDSP